PCSFEGQLRWTTDRVARHYHRRSAKSQEKRRRAGAVSSRGCRKMDQKRRLEGWKAGRLEGWKAGRRKGGKAKGRRGARLEGRKDSLISGLGRPRVADRA